MERTHQVGRRQTRLVIGARNEEAIDDHLRLARAIATTAIFDLDTSQTTFGGHDE